MSSKGSGGAAASGRGTGSVSQRAATGNGGSGGEGDFKSPLTRAEKTALENYSGNSFALINARLRGQEKRLSDYNRRTLRNVTSAMDKASLGRDRLVFRGINHEALHAAVASGKLKKGKVITEMAFASATTRFSTARSFATARARGSGSPVVFRIAARKGSKVAELGGLSSISHGSKGLEREVLFQRGSSMRVVKSEMRKGVAVITVRLGR